MQRSPGPHTMALSDDIQQNLLNLIASLADHSCPDGSYVCSTSDKLGNNSMIQAMWIIGQSISATSIVPEKKKIFLLFSVKITYSLLERKSFFHL